MYWLIVTTDYSSTMNISLRGIITEQTNSSFRLKSEKDFLKACGWSGFEDLPEF